MSNSNTRSPGERNVRKAMALHANAHNAAYGAKLGRSRSDSGSVSDEKPPTRASASLSVRASRHRLSRSLARHFITMDASSSGTDGATDCSGVTC